MLVVAAGVHVLSPGQKVSIYRDKSSAAAAAATAAAQASAAVAPVASR